MGDLGQFAKLTDYLALCLVLIFGMKYGLQYVKESRERRNGARNSSGAKSPEWWTLEISRIVEKKLGGLVETQEEMLEALRRIEKMLLSRRKNGTPEDT